jgi:hypothetical protein
MTMHITKIWFDGDEVVMDHIPVSEIYKQEPMAWTLLLLGEHNGIIGKAGDKFLGHPEHYKRVNVYTTPPAAQRQWVGLTDEEIILLSGYDLNYAALIGEVQKKLKEKNT